MGKMRHPMGKRHRQKMGCHQTMENCQTMELRQTMGPRQAMEHHPVMGRHHWHHQMALFLLQEPSH